MSADYSDHFQMLGKNVATPNSRLSDGDSPASRLAHVIQGTASENFTVPSQIKPIDKTTGFCHSLGRKG